MHAKPVDAQAKSANLLVNVRMFPCRFGTWQMTQPVLLFTMCQAWSQSIRSIFRRVDTVYRFSRSIILHARLCEVHQ